MTKCLLTLSHREAWSATQIASSPLPHKNRSREEANIHTKSTVLLCQASDAAGTHTRNWKTKYFCNA